MDEIAAIIAWVMSLLIRMIVMDVGVGVGTDASYGGRSNSAGSGKAWGRVVKTICRALISFHTYYGFVSI